MTGTILLSAFLSLILPDPGMAAVEVRAGLKYEIPLSMHVLTRTGHHPEFQGWADGMRATLRAETLRQVEALADNVHEWQIANLLARYEGPDDSMESLSDYLTGPGRSYVTESVRSWGNVLPERLKISPEHFPDFFASLIRSYYREGFAAPWSNVYFPSIRAQAEASKKALSQLKLDIPGFMLSQTGYPAPQSSSNLFLYPSMFSRPSHAYGFEEPRGLALLYQVGSSDGFFVDTILHESLHPVLGRTSWEEKNERVKGAIKTLEQSALLREDWMKGGKSSYQYPSGWIDELVVHTLAKYWTYKLGLYDRGSAREKLNYSSFQTALFDCLERNRGLSGDFDKTIISLFANIRESKNGFYCLLSSQG